jgi:WD40 repeat protein
MASFAVSFGDGITDEDDEYMKSPFEDQSEGVGALLQEVKELKMALQLEKDARMKLEEECDVLSLANQDLQENVHRLNSKLRIYTALHDQKTSSPLQDDNSVVSAISNLHEGLAVGFSAAPGNHAGALARVSEREPPVRGVALRIRDVCGSSNPVSVTFFYPRSASAAASDAQTSSQPRASPSSVWLACGGADKLVRVYALELHAESQEWRWRLNREVSMPGPVLWLDSWEGFVAASCMDGSTAIIDLSDVEVNRDAELLRSSHCRPEHKQSDDGLSEERGETVTAAPPYSSASSVCALRKHNKYAVCIKFSPDGRLAASLAYDRTVAIYERVSADSVGGADLIYAFDCAAAARPCAWRHVASYDFVNTPESLVFLPSPSAAGGAGDSAAFGVFDKASVSSGGDCASDGNGPSSSGAWRLVVAVRGCRHLQSLPTSAPYTASNFMSVNEASWDSHVGLTALLLSSSPDFRYLTVCTDKNFHFVVDVSFSASTWEHELGLADAAAAPESRSKRLALLVGHACGEYGKPALAWDPFSPHCYGNSEDGTHLMVWSPLDDVRMAGSVLQQKGVAALGIGGASPNKKGVACRLEGHSAIVRALAVCRHTQLVATISYDHTLVLWK